MGAVTSPPVISADDSKRARHVAVLDSSSILQGKAFEHFHVRIYIVSSPLSKSIFLLYLASNFCSCSHSQPPHPIGWKSSNRAEVFDPLSCSRRSGEVLRKFELILVSLAIRTRTEPQISTLRT